MTPVLAAPVYSQPLLNNKKASLSLKKARRAEKKARKERLNKQQDERNETASELIDHQLTKPRDLDAFFLRRIEFAKYTRPDARQDALRKKYRPINAPDAVIKAAQSANTSSIVVRNNDATAMDVDQAEPLLNRGEALVLPKRGLFSEEKLQPTWRNIQPIGPGLLNLGNTCFLNSVLQCLTYTPSLAQYMLESGHSRTCRIPGFCMLCELEVHLKQCLRREGGGGGYHAVRPGRIVGRLRAIAKHMRLGRQEDAHEFLRYLVDAMQTSCLVDYESNIDQRLKETTMVYRVFGGYLRSQVHCLDCDHRSNTYDPLLDLSVDLAGVDSVEKALRRFTRPEKLTRENRYRCDSCRQMVEARKRFTVERAPATLTLHLKRFNHFGEKIGKPIDFNEVLDLTPCLSSQVDIRDAERAGKPVHSLARESAKYQLYAVLVHSGSSCRSGHYYSYVKSAAGMWHCMNDDSVDQVSAKRVMNEKAYILFYTRLPSTTRSTEQPSVTTQKQKNTQKDALATPVNHPSKPVKAKNNHMDIGESIDRTDFIANRQKDQFHEKKSNGIDNSLEMINNEQISRKLSKKEKKRLRKQKKRELLERESAVSSTAPTDYNMISTNLQSIESKTVTSSIIDKTTTLGLVKNNSTLALNKSVSMTKKQPSASSTYLAATPAPIVKWDENEDVKSAKLDAVIQREEARKKTQSTESATTLEAIFGPRDKQSQYDGKLVKGWDVVTANTLQGTSTVTREERDQLVKSMIKKKKRPSTYDLEYDRPKERKRKRDGAGAQAIWQVQKLSQKTASSVFQKKMDELHERGVPRSLQKSKSGKKRRPAQY